MCVEKTLRRQIVKRLRADPALRSVEIECEPVKPSSCWSSNTFNGSKHSLEVVLCAPPGANLHVIAQRASELVTDEDWDVGMMNGSFLADIEQENAAIDGLKARIFYGALTVEA